MGSLPARLKFLELHGYKTFAARTRFEFAGSVTAIVGPNGSGKSNIADAVRWVLGEQSYSLLRGKKTEDMIFSGSEQRPRAGMASATITFDNSDAWLPIDFAEVAITRRAYRDGENEYLLNGQRVRLRDVSELLAQSGLAERTYTIIGQGLVDAALALKAEERRKLFEEAAGIGLHRSRRDEALRRLDTTRRNLERVQDILAELQPRLRSLERQARRAQEYEQVKADLRVLLREWYGYHWRRAQGELTEVREDARLKENALEKARRESSGLDRQLSERREKIQELRASLNEWHRQSAQLHTQRENSSRDLAVAGERVRALAEGRQNVIDEQLRSEEEASLSRDRLEQVSVELTQLESELKEAQAQAEAVRQALKARQAERSAAEKNVQAARQALSALTARQGHLQARLAERHAQANRQAESLKAAIQAIEPAGRELHESEKILESALRASQEAQAARLAAEEAVQSHRSRIAEMEAGQKEALEELTTVGAEAARLKAQLEVLEQAEQALSGYAGGAQLLIQAARQTRLKGVQGALSSFLEVPAELETAIAAALGEFVDAVLLEGPDSSDEALDILEDQPSKAALISLDALVSEKQPRLVRDGEDSQVLGVAANMIGAPAGLRKAVDVLLGHVLVVRDRAAARRVLSGREPWVRVVTLRGEVFYAGGQILAGFDKKPGILSRPRQRRELQQAFEEAHAQQSHLEGQARRLELQLTDLRAAGEKLSSEAQEARKQEESCRSSHSQAELKREKTQRQYRWQLEQRDRLEAEIDRARAETGQISTELESLEGQVEHERQNLRELAAVLNGLSLEECQNDLAHWNTRAAVAERACSEAQERRKERQSSLERANRNRELLQERLAEMDTATQTLEAEIAALRQAEAQLNRQIEALQQVIGPAEAELDKAEREQTRLQTAEAGARQELSMAEHRHAQARILLARRQEALDGLRRRIEDDFGLVAFDYAEEISGPTPLPLDGMVEQLPRVKKIGADVEENIRRQRGQLRRMGAINPEAQAEYQQVKERYEFLKDQVSDLNQAELDVKAVIHELDLIMQREFRKTFEAVAKEFREIFTRLFDGGTARLLLTDPEDLTDTGIDIEARLPGRRAQGLSLLSGGERSLTATALVFSLLRVSPTPFCLLDEVDAMLDEANVGRFRELLRELSERTQFVIVTHNRNTVQAADVIYGVTMGRDSSSQVISLKLDEVDSIIE